jgi:ribosomal protein S18 acetylase RimI-like enzyme
MPTGRIMEEKVRSLLLDYAQRKTGATPALLDLHAPDPWDLRIRFDLPGSGLFEIRNVRADDLETFLAFSDGLSPASRESFRPYPWDSKDQLLSALHTAINQAVTGVDACYLMFHEALPVGEFFLWKAGGNPDARLHGVEVPELGIGFADSYHGRGFGGLCTRLLTIVAEHLRADGIELTTAIDNESGFHTYLSAGYEYVGDIANPLEADVTAVLGEQASAARWRVERQMIRVINQNQRAELLAYLAEKRRLSSALAARSSSIRAG